jgi:hypothetical protein
MASFLQQFGGQTSASGTTTTITVPAGGITAGHSLVLSMVTLTALAPAVSTVSGTDTRGNAYSFLGQAPVTGATTSVVMLASNITATLAAGDTITLTTDVAATRTAVSVHEYDVTLTADVQATADNGGVSTAALTTGTTATTSSANELVVGAFALVSSGRIFTVGSGYAEGTKVLSTFGSGDRAVVAEYKFVATTGTQTATGSLNSSALYVGMVQTFTYAAGGGGGGGGSPRPGSGNPKVWNGSAWVAHPAKVWNDGTAWVDSK